MSRPAANSYDVVIVGAGTAGCVLAARLSEDPQRRVALVEAGAFESDPRIADPLQWPFLEGAAFDWAYRTVPQSGTAGRVHRWPRGRVVGGSSCINAMAHVRGHPDDFRAWAEVAGPGWGFASLLPYFVRSESFSDGPSELHGDSGPLDVLLPPRLHPLAEDFMLAGEELGIPPSGDHNGPRMEGAARNSLTIRDGRRLSAADAYLTPALDRPNLSVVTGFHVARVLGATGGAVRGVEGSLGGGGSRLEAPLVLLAAGAVATPALLMRSGIGPSAELAAHGIRCELDLPAVGANLHDHLLAAGNVYLADRPVAASRLQHSESLMYVGRGGEVAPDLVVGCVVLPVTSECFQAPPVGTAYTLLCGFTHPRSRGSVRLGGPGPADPPRLDPAYLSDPRDRDAFRASLELARELGASRSLARWRRAELLPGPGSILADDLDAFLARAAITHHHPVGTCAMGADAASSVVDAELRVWGVDGLRVVDASVIPTITTGPVHAAVVAIAERAASIVRDG